METQKDAQQVAVIKAVVRDLNFPIQIVVCPTLRETNGLAMSSRNIYLSDEQRQAAGIIYRALMETAEAYARGEHDALQLQAVVRNRVREAPDVVLDYVSVTNAVTLQETNVRVGEPLLVSLVVKMGSTRLLDNILLPVELNDRQGLTQVLGGYSY